MEANPKVPPVQPIPEPLKPQTMPDATSQDQNNLALPLNVPAYVVEPTVYRLVIDKDPVSGSYIYKTVDRITGQTMNQLPSEEVQRLKDDASYKAGSVFDSKA